MAVVVSAIAWALLVVGRQWQQVGQNSVVVVPKTVENKMLVTICNSCCCSNSLAIAIAAVVVLVVVVK
jgi:hypothetical protein